jgi:hypothetical protein
VAVVDIVPVPGDSFEQTLASDVLREMIRAFARKMMDAEVEVACGAGTVAALLEPGGFLYLVEAHPVAQILDDAQGTTVVRDYFDGRPQVEGYPYTYTDGPGAEARPERGVPAPDRADRNGAGDRRTANRLPERARLRCLAGCAREERWEE